METIKKPLESKYAQGVSFLSGPRVGINTQIYLFVFIKIIKNKNLKGIYQRTHFSNLTQI